MALIQFGSVRQAKSSASAQQKFPFWSIPILESKSDKIKAKRLKNIIDVRRFRQYCHGKNSSLISIDFAILAILTSWDG